MFSDMPKAIVGDVEEYKSFETFSITIPKNQTSWTVPTNGMAKLIIADTYNSVTTSNTYAVIADATEATTKNLGTLAGINARTTNFTETGVTFSGGAISTVNDYIFMGYIVY